MPGVGRGIGWGLELDWENIMKKQSSIDGNSKVIFETKDVKTPRASSMC